MKPDMAVIGPSKGTKGEKIVAEFLGVTRARMVFNDRSLPGSPDIHLPRLKTAIFVDGRFWHDPNYAKARSRRHHRTNFFHKALRNQKRDRRNTRDLKKLGYSVIRIWDTSLKKKMDREKTLAKLYVALSWQAYLRLSPKPVSVPRAVRL